MEPLHRPPAKPELRALLVEDRDPDAELIGAAVESMRHTVELWRARSTTEALAFLQRAPPFEHVPRPDVVISDLGLPGDTGLDLLHEMKAEPATAAIPVVVVASTSDPGIVYEAYQAGATAFVPKPRDLAGLVNAMDVVSRLFCEVAALVDERHRVLGPEDRRH